MAHKFNYLWGNFILQLISKNYLINLIPTCFVCHKLYFLLSLNFIFHNSILSNKIFFSTKISVISKSTGRVQIVPQGLHCGWIHVSGRLPEKAAPVILQFSGKNLEKKDKFFDETSVFFTVNDRCIFEWIINRTYSANTIILVEKFISVKEMD